MSSETKVISTILIITVIVIFAGLSLTKNGPKSAEISVDTTNLISSTTPIQGNQNAKVSIVEFGDFACPACAMLAPNLEAALAGFQTATSTNDVSFALRLIPIHGPDSIQSAMAAFAAREQAPEQFFAMSHLLFTKQTEWASKGTAKQNEIFIGYAKSLNLDTVKFAALLDSSEFKNTVTNILNTDNADARRMNIGSTPTLVINGKPIVGVQSEQTLKDMIAAELALANNPTATTTGQ